MTKAQLKEEIAHLNAEICNSQMNLGVITYIDDSKDYIFYYHHIGNDGELFVKTALGKSYIVYVNQYFAKEFPNWEQPIRAYELLDNGCYRYINIKQIQLKTMQYIHE